jgi:hypothetical protein
MCEFVTNVTNTPHHDTGTQKIIAHLLAANLAANTLHFLKEAYLTILKT